MSNLNRESITNKLKTFLSYKDEMGNSIVTQQAIEDAVVLVSNFPNNIKPPKVSVAEDGEVNFDWTYPDSIRLDLGVYGTGTYSYFAKFKNGTELIQNNVSISAHLPIIVLQALS